MASPFEVQPPAWLSRIAQPIDTQQAGETIALGLAGAVNAATKDESFSSGIAEARLNQADPLWKQKFQVSMENARLGQQARWMQVQESGARLSVLDETLKAKQALAQDEADDQIAYAQAKADVGNDALKLVNHTMPAFKSPKYRMMWQTDVNTAKNADAVIERNQSAMALRQQQVKDAAEFDKSLAALSDPKDRVSIQREKDPTKRYEMLADAQARQQDREAQKAADAGLVVTRQTTGPRGTTTIMGVPKGDELYSEAPKIQNIGGENWVFWGKQMHKIANKAEEGQMRVIVDRVVKLQDALIKSPENATEAAADNSLTRQLLDARRKLNLKEKEASDKLPSSTPKAGATTSSGLKYTIEEVK